MDDEPKPLPEELTTMSLLRMGAQIAADHYNQFGGDPVTMNINIQRAIRQRIDQEDHEAAYNFLKMGALFNMRARGIGEGAVAVNQNPSRHLSSLNFEN